MGLPNETKNGSGEDAGATSLETKRAQQPRNSRTASLLLLIALVSLALFLNHMGVFDGTGHRDAAPMRR